VSGGPNASTDLTKDEQKHVRAAMFFLKTRYGGWGPLAVLLHMKFTTLSRAANGGSVSASLAFRVARVAQVPVDDVVAGRFPGEGTCPMCGHRKEAELAE
jgi:hypothetical protein